MRFKSVVLLWFFSLVIPVKAQTDDENLVKYWHYRERLKNDFMLGIGTQAGFSIPASIRNTNIGRLSWGDATVDQSFYIGVLATEYYLLSQSNENIDATIEELYHALYAVDRLDINAEAYFGGTPLLNGFFIRDDVSPYGLNMSGYVIPHLNQGLPSPVITELYSDFMSIEPTDKEMSQDQVLHLMWALGLVIKYVPPTVYYESGGIIRHFPSGLVNFVEESKDIINKFVNYMKGGPGWNWIIYNPVTGIQVARGGNAFNLSAAFAGAKYMLTGQTTPTTDIAAGNIADNIFKSFQNYWVINDQDFKVIMLDAMSNYWPNGVVLDGSNNEYNAMVIGARATTNPYNPLWVYEFVTLYHQALHGGGNYLGHSPVDGFFKGLLDQAPCAGPYNHSSSGSPDYYSYEWSATSRTLHPDGRGKTEEFLYGDYNGLDYMLIHNLYRLVYRNNLHPYLNMNTANVAIDFPYSSTGPIIGNNLSPYTIESLTNITANNHINSTGHVNYRAGKTITLKPGFLAFSGANFKAYIDPLDCDGNKFKMFKADGVFDQNEAQDYSMSGVGDLPQFESNLEKTIREQNTALSLTTICDKCYLFQSWGFEPNTLFTLKTFDSSGKLVNKKTVNMESDILDLNGLSTGLYITQITTTNTIQTHKIIIKD